MGEKTLGTLCIFDKHGNEEIEMENLYVLRVWKHILTFSIRDAFEVIYSYLK